MQGGCEKDVFFVANDSVERRAGRKPNNAD
jgi:hypothetical protein